MSPGFSFFLLFVVLCPSEQLFSLVETKPLLPTLGSKCATLKDTTWHPSQVQTRKILTEPIHVHTDVFKSTRVCIRMTVKTVLAVHINSRLAAPLRPLWGKILLELIHADVFKSTKV